MFNHANACALRSSTSDMPLIFRLSSIESIVRLQKSKTNRTNFGVSSTVTTGKRRREKIRDILANVREGFAKRRARMTHKGDAAKLDVSVVRSFGSALGIQTKLASGGEDADL